MKNAMTRDVCINQCSLIPKSRLEPGPEAFAFIRHFRFCITTSDLRGDRLRQLLRRRAAAEIRRAILAAGDDTLDRADDAVVEIAAAEMIEEHRARPDRADRIRDALARDVGRGAVNG